MRHLPKLGTLAMLLAFGSNMGCSKEKEEATTAQVTNTEPASKAEAAANVPGMAKETLLALKFHHDS